MRRAAVGAEGECRRRADPEAYRALGRGGDAERGITAGWSEAAESGAVGAHGEEPLLLRCQPWGKKNRESVIDLEDDRPCVRRHPNSLQDPGCYRQHAILDVSECGTEAERIRN